MLSREGTLSVLLEAGAVVVIRVGTMEQAVASAKALQASGLRAIEISLVTPGALDAIRALRCEIQRDTLLGAGTVLDAETARLAILAGADFIVSPVCHESLVRAVHRYHAVVLGGALTPTEILDAWEIGCDLVKVFPADCAGGPAYIKAVHAPLPQVLLAPTGGVDLNNAADYIRAGSAVLGIGSSLVSKTLVEQSDYATIRERGQRLREIIVAAREEIRGVK